MQAIDLVCLVGEVERSFAMATTHYSPTGKSKLPEILEFAAERDQSIGAKDDLHLHSCYPDEKGAKNQKPKTMVDALPFYGSRSIGGAQSGRLHTCSRNAIPLVTDYVGMRLVGLFRGCLLTYLVLPQPQSL